MDEKKKTKKGLMKKYRLTIRNESELGKALGFYISPLAVIMSLILSFLGAVGIIYLIIVFTPVGEYLPGYVNEKAREKQVRELLRVDSLNNELAKQDRYIRNIKAIMSGVEPDSILPPDTLNTKEGYPIATTELESKFAAQFEKDEKYNLTSQASAVGALQELHLFRPTGGIITRKFDANLRHYGVDIAQNPGEGVLAILDGTVIMSDYTANDGYMLVVQHKQNLTSVYRNCHAVLKKAGDKVIGGEVIATLGKDTEADKEKETTETNIKKPYLHFELWHRGEALNPEIYIAF
ncbi:MAG: M23 family metallopeptidase [Bacteroidaceae bacterium]|jgi:lipoprotein NlpD|nr:M23 family metallopeptidase [Bacteroidales bacterium]MBR6805825.1 M23 family metallopeptidase [Bacteroidaceae bacterium]